MYFLVYAWILTTVIQAPSSSTSQALQMFLLTRLRSSWPKSRSAMSFVQIATELEPLKAPRRHLHDTL